MKGIKKYFSLNIVVIFKLVLFGLIFSFFSIAINADSVELYEDPATGQVFTKPGPGRKKISSSDINQGSSKSNSKLKVNGRVQVRSVAGQKDSVFSNGHSDYNAWDTGFRRLRIGLAYEGDKWWGGIVDLKMENLLNSPYSTTKSVTIPGADGNSYTVLKEEKLNDSRGGVQEANIWVKAPFMSSIFYFGQQRVRFLREGLESFANLLIPERAFALSFTQLWDIGIFADAHPLELINKKYTNYMKVSGSVMNGKGSGHDGVGRQRVLTDTHSGTQPLLITPMLSWRIEVNPFDGLVKDGKSGDWREGEEIFQKNLKVSLGMSGVTAKELKYVNSYDPQTRGVSKFNTLTEQSSATGGDYTLPNSNPYNLALAYAMDFSPGGTNIFRRSFGLNAHTYDFTATWKGLYANGAYTYFSGSAAKDTKTYHVTLGYNYPISSYFIMPVVRYDFMKGDFDRNYKTEDFERFKAYWVGLNFFGRHHDFKVQLFYNILRDHLGTNYVTQKRRDADNNLIYFQVQVTFGEEVALNHK